MTAMRFFLGLTVVAILVHLAMADTYLVGGADGWSLGTDFASWASSQTFQTGDILTFSYDDTLHSVVEVSKDDYDACSLSNPIASGNDGNTLVSLTSSGSRYFICGTPGHCAAGMKVEVDTLSTAGNTPSQASPPAISPIEAPTADSPPPPSPPASNVVPSASPTVDSPPLTSDSPPVTADVPTTSPTVDSPPTSDSPPVAADAPTTSPTVDSPHLPASESPQATTDVPADNPRPKSNSQPNLPFGRSRSQFSAANGFKDQHWKVEILLALGMVVALVL